MIRTVLSRLRSGLAPSERIAVDETVTYVVGDVHGCDTHLDALLEGIAEHAGGRPRNLVLLGDYVDRGPGSARVIETLRALQAREPDRVVCLMGNHESMLLAAADGRGEDIWRINGGDAVLASYGVRRACDLPAEVIAWIRGLPTVHGDALHWYVHAGFRPTLPAPDPDVGQRLWIREPFLKADHDFGRHVVHGHTPIACGRPEVRRHRTNLDTGAVFGGALTAGVFTESQGPAVQFLRVTLE
ncbi:metallophosphoesterase family protein [Methylobacterium oryzihabitans]|uniref:Serine/threonine protein phosphatase n=1 Tax=Methylobacterium oryzihabitans TaxID=2499852 RepID=A0A3S2VB04_9HYPH|nr:metallophosphoesterase family protein [Methylobacterium oryzihabitans]RVU18772.1 serine/threonine protein phosphatase [Methylobacterium oryzihabitans]